MKSAVQANVWHTYVDFFDEAGTYEILQEAIKEGLRMSGWRALNYVNKKRYELKMNEWMNVTID